MYAIVFESSVERVADVHLCNLRRLLQDTPVADDRCNPELFVGDELISIALAVFYIEFRFNRDVLQISGDFILNRNDQKEELFRPSQKLGSLPALWSLISRSVASVRWEKHRGGEIELTFDDASQLRILPVESGFRGTIMGGNPPPGALLIEDF